jgi:ATP-binding cassette, subfamily B, bacterial MsbA
LRRSVHLSVHYPAIHHADEIIVSQKGKIAERGTREKLLRQNGFYKKLVEMQEVK